MKRIARFVGIAIAALLVVLISLPFLIDANQFRPTLQSSLTQALGREVKVGDLKLSLLSGGVSASDLSIADDPAFSRTPFVTAQSMKIGVDIWPLLFQRKLNVTAVTVDKPTIALTQSPAGVWNFASIGAKQAPSAAAPSAQSGLDMSVNLVKISGCRLSLRNLTLDDVSIEVRDFSPASAFPVSLSAKVAGGGEIKLDGKVGPLSQGDAVMTPLDVSLNVSKLDLAGSGFAAPASGMAGLVSFVGTVTSNGQTLQLKAKLQADRLKLAANGAPASRKVEFDFTVAHDLKTRTGTLNPGDVHIGAAQAALTGGYKQSGDALILNMTLNGTAMALTELAAMLPALGVTLPAGSSLQSGSAGAKLALAGPTDRLVVTGSLGVSNARLAGFDLGSKLSAVARLAGVNANPNTDIQAFSANIRVAPDGTRADDIKLVAPSIGELNGAGTISPSHALDFKMRATVHSAGGAIALISKGETSIPFVIEGTSSNPVFRPDMKGIASAEAKGIAKGAAQKAAGGMLGGLFGKKK